MPTSPAGSPRIGGQLATDRHNQQVGLIRAALRAAYHHARHYIGWAVDVDTRLAEHMAGAGSPLVHAAVAAGVRVELAATLPGSRYLERRLKRWHKTGQFCPRCRAARGGKAR
jgi:predicted GIY-YIG superfamily endonuclease